MDNAFDLLEARVRRAAEALGRLQGENADLRKQVERAQAALHQAEKALQAAEKEQSGRDPADAQKVDALEKEVQALQEDKEAIRDRIARIVGVLDGLD